jgi:hypothetical protein
MAKTSSFMAKAAYGFAASFLAASLAGGARAGDKPQLSGYWKYNASQSDDADRKVHEAQVNNERPLSDGAGGAADPTAGTSYPGGGGGGGIYPSGGGMGGRGGMGGMGGMGGGMGHGRQGTRSPEVSSEDWDQLAANPKYLHIDQRSDQVEVSNDSDQGRTFYTDGKKHDDKDSDGKKISTKGNWEADNFVAESKMNRSHKITDTYRLSSDGKQLFVTTRFEDSALNAPVMIRRVYDVSKAPAQ